MKIPQEAAKEWIDVEKELPKQNTKVRWRCNDGTKDVGFYNDRGDFVTFDPISLNPITSWKYFENPIK